MTETLVRVVAKDGSVWWVLPALVDTYAALSQAILPSDQTARDAAKLYWRDRKA